MIRTIVLRSLLASILWWILTEGRFDTWGLGMIAMAVAVWASLRLFPLSSVRFSFFGLITFLRLFIWNSICGAIQVSFAAFRGSHALQPNILEMKLSLPPGGARVLLVNTLGLMPGTLGVQLDDDRLRLHVLDDRFPIAAEAQLMERSIARLFMVKI